MRAKLYVFQDSEWHERGQGTFALNERHDLSASRLGVCVEEREAGAYMQRVYRALSLCIDVAKLVKGAFSIYIIPHPFTVNAPITHSYMHIHSHVRALYHTSATVMRLDMSKRLVLNAPMWGGLNPEKITDKVPAALCSSTSLPPALSICSLPIC